jgi:hydroxypyruvate reductase
LRLLLDDALAAADPAVCIPPQLESLPTGAPLIVLGAGKAAAAMAAAVDAGWSGPLRGLVVTRYGHAVPNGRVEVVEAAHPVPDAAGQDAAARLLQMARDAGPDDTILFLLSGGASALLSLPADGLLLEDKQAVTRQLLDGGATIGELNTVRKHLSAIKGGRLAAAAQPAHLMTWAISDVVNDDPSVIGSGPTVADPTTLADALAVLDRFSIEPPVRVAACLADPANETPKQDNPMFSSGDYRIIARAQDSLTAAMDRARSMGLHPVLHSAAAEGEARAVAIHHAHQITTRLADGILPPPWVQFSGGEATVTVTGEGRGGPNTEFALALAIALDGAPGVWALAADTDGTDGAAEAAGAFVAPDTLARAAAAGLDPERALADNDSYSFFDSLGDLVMTGPTHTNVNDFRAILVTEMENGQ